MASTTCRSYSGSNMQDGFEGAESEGIKIEKLLE